MIKKKLVVDPVEGQLVIKIYDLYLDGPLNEGPLGIKNLVSYLNERGYAPGKARDQLGPQDPDIPLLR